MTGETRDPVDDLVRLSALEPDAVRAEQTRERCRAILRRRATRTSGQRDVATQPKEGPRRLRPAIVAAFGLLCMAYVGELVAAAVRLLTR